MTRLATVLIAVAAIAAPRLALAAPPVWSVDHAASRLTFSGQVSGQGFTGAFKKWDAVIHFDPKDLAHSDVAATIDMTSFATGSQDRDSELPDEDWFWTSHFPTATFVAHGFTAAGPGRYNAAGVLTLRGAAKPLTLPFTLAITGDVAKMNGQVALSRLAFGIGQGEWQSTDTVAAAVTVGVDLTADKAAH
ncbi:MAG TPA: YceI family protein [Caulobacteraceae bacterium]|jgi:polyisoprenoid-binding protein YceI